MTNRVMRVLGDDAESKAAFTSKVVDKAGFFERAKNVFGDDLKAMIMAEIEEKSESFTEVELQGSWDFSMVIF